VLKNSPNKDREEEDVKAEVGVLNKGEEEGSQNMNKNLVYPRGAVYCYYISVAHVSFVSSKRM
jgi:hypothetical protein